MSPPAALGGLAQVLAASRVAFGAHLVVRPQQAAGFTWVRRRQARRPEVRVFARAQGARDVGLGAGALWALRGGQDPRPWLLAQALGDSADLLGTAAARGHLPPRRSAFAMAAAVGSIGVALAAAATAGRGAGPSP